MKNARSLFSDAMQSERTAKAQEYALISEMQKKLNHVLLLLCDQTDWLGVLSFNGNSYKTPAWNRYQKSIGQVENKNRLSIKELARKVALRAQGK